MLRLILVLIIGLICFNEESQGGKVKAKENKRGVDLKCILCLGGTAASCITTCLEGPSACLACIAEKAPQCLAVCGFGRVLKGIEKESIRKDDMDPCVQTNTDYPVERSGIISATKNVPDANACGVVCRGVDQNILAGWVYANVNEPNDKLRFTCFCLNFLGTPIKDFARDSGVGKDCPPA